MMSIEMDFSLSLVVIGRPHKARGVDSIPRTALALVVHMKEEDIVHENESRNEIKLSSVSWNA